MVSQRKQQEQVEREQTANIVKHWVRISTACNSSCMFCLDTDTPRNLILPDDEVRQEIQRGREALDAERLVLSGGEATIHPSFIEFVAFGRSIGYSRVQIITNGWQLANKDFYQKAIKAGLGEITFSLHGHTAQLHDELTQHPGAFQRLLKGMARAARDPRVITNVDVVINKKNIPYIDKIVELCLSLGVSEFDLLHIIPHGAAYENREQLFYEPREHLPLLQKVFRLNRHPRVVVWTNRFPVSYLEGLEDLIQDPHKIFDEINGRRWQFRRYLDTGQALDCRQSERCQHCFIEACCTHLDEVLRRASSQTVDVWYLGRERFSKEELPFGIHRVGLHLQRPEDLPEELGETSLYLRCDEPDPLPPERFGRASIWLEASTPEQLDAWLGEPRPQGVEIFVQLNQDTAPWLLEHRELLQEGGLRIIQPHWEHLHQAVSKDVRDPAGFFSTLKLRLPVAGLPACLAPGTERVDAPLLLSPELFDSETGRLTTEAIARLYVTEGYTAHSVRCDDCLLRDRCPGLHINQIRDQGLSQLKPLREGAWAQDALAQLTARWPQPPPRLSAGCPPQSPIPSLPGHPPPGSAGPEQATDPLSALAARKKDEEQRRRQAKRQQQASQKDGR